MALRYVIVPVIADWDIKGNRGPKYFENPPSVNVPEPWDGAPYGQEPWMLVVSDLSASSVTFLQAQTDAFLIPANVDATLTAVQVTNVSTKLEAINIPADTITTASTWRIVLRRALACLRFLSRFQHLYLEAGNRGLPVFRNGITLATTIGALSQAVRDALLATADDLGLNRTGITGASTLRQLFVSVADQQQGTPQPIGSGTV